MAMMAKGVNPSASIFFAAAMLRPPRSSLTAARLPQRKSIAPRRARQLGEHGRQRRAANAHVQRKDEHRIERNVRAAPSTTSRMACAAKPCAIIIWFSPVASRANTVPIKYVVK